MQFKTKYTFQSDEHIGEINNDPSQTREDMSYTVKELLEKFTRGIDPMVVKQGSYDDEPDFDSIDPSRFGDFDLVDLQEMEIEYQQRLQHVREAQEAAKQKAAELPGGKPPAPDGEQAKQAETQ